MSTETQNDPFYSDDVSFLDFGSDDVGETPDLHTIPEQEAKLELSGLRAGVGKDSGNPYWMATLIIADDPNAASITHVMMLPTAEDDARRVQQKNRSRKYFCQAFGIPTSGKVDIDAYIGREAWAFVTEEEDSGSQIGRRNRVRRWVAGH